MALAPDPGTVPVMIDQLTHTMRELDGRSSGGIDVQLLWDEHDGEVVVTVADGKTGDRFLLEVRAQDNALDVFRHPFAYAAWRGVDAGGAQVPCVGLR